MKLLSGGLNFLISAGATIALSFATKAITDWVTKNERLAESAKESAEALNSENDGLENLKQKYIEVFDGELSEAEKSKQLIEIKNELIDKYKIEEEQLKNINKERQNTIDLIDAETRKNRDTWLRENSKAIDNAKKDIERNMKSLQEIASISFESTSDIDKSVLELMKISNDIYGNKSLSVDAKNLIEFYDVYEEIAGKLTSKQYTRDLSESEKILLNRANDVVNTFQKIIDESRDVYETASSYNAQNFFEDFLKIDGNSLDNINTQNVNQWKESLIKALDNSELGYEEKEEVQNLMKSALQEINISPEIQVNPIFTYDRDAVDNAVSAVENMFYEKDSDGNNKSTIFDKIEKFEKAIENIGKNGFIERTDYEELLELYPEIANVFEQSADGYTTTLTKINSATQSYIQQNKDVITESRNVITTQISDLLKEIVKDNEKVAKARAKGYDGIYEFNQANEVLKQHKQQWEELTDTLQDFEDKETSLNFDSEKLVIDATTESISKLNSSMKTLSGAFAEINENGTLSVDTLLTLIENGYATAVMYNNQTGAITLNKKVIEELTKTKIIAQIAELKGQLATSQHTKEIEAQIIALEHLRDNWSSIYDGTFSNTDTSGTSSIKEDTTDYYKENAEAQIEALKHEYAIGNLTTEDYYNQLLDLAKYYYEGKTEYLDDYRKYEEEVYKGLQEAQKERLESEKEKISEVNDENERAIELIKAQIELENSRKNKTIRTYSEETGFNYTTDEKDILDKKLKLDKIIAETKERFIDGQISEIDKMNFDALRNALNTPISIPTNEEIMQESYRQTVEYITNNNKNNSNNYTINVDKIVTDNPQDFLNQLNELLQIGINQSRVGM